jgi:hypothetical protein
MNLPLTKPPGVPDRSEATPGMAHYEGSGPSGKTCGDCNWRGYYREGRKGTWNANMTELLYRSYRVLGCFKFKAMTGTDGPPVRADYRACRYFQQKAR